MTLAISGLSKSFGPTEAVRDVSFEVAVATRMALVGASGSGKSTVLRLIAGFERPDAGVVAVDGTAFNGAGGLTPAHQRGIGYVAQDGALFPHLTVRQNIAFGLPRGVDRDTRIWEVLRLVRLEEPCGERYPHELSGGQQQRVALARALAPRPRAILLDEPFSALDTGLRDHTRAAVIAALEQEGVTAILVTHDQDEALAFGQSLGVLSNGLLLQTGEPTAVFDSPISAAVAALLGPAVFITASRDGGRVASSIGLLDVRHEHCGSENRVTAMVRPSQVTLSPPHHPSSGSISPVTIAGLRAIGADTEVTLALPADAEQMVVRIPAHLARELRIGDATHVQISGGVVLYPRE